MEDEWRYPMVSDYLSRGFAPIDFETQVDHLTTEGRWPADLSGTLYRIGPNPQFEPIEPYNPLLGDGMVHAFRIRGPDIGYRNRWVRTQQWRLEHEAGRALFATSGDPRHNDPLAGTRPTDGAANTSLFWHAGRLLVLEEAHAPLVLDPLTLETLGAWDFHGRLPSNMTAHPKLDPETGEALFFANYPSGRFDGEIAWYVADREGHITSQHTLTAPFPAIVHDFGVTRDYVVFPICPATISLARARSGGPAIAWEPDEGTHVALVRRDAPHDVTWFTAPARFVWHVLNCWNEDGQVIVDLCEQAAPAFPAADGSMSPERLWCQRLSRWELSPGRRPDVRIGRLADQVCEYPRSDERFAMRPTGHGYFACHGGPGTGDPFHRGVAHFDFGSGRMSTFCFGPTSAVSEPVFVPRGETAAEGGGYVLCLVYEEDRDRSCIAVLDAQRVADGPLAGAWLDHRVPVGFHGCWIGENDLGGVNRGIHPEDAQYFCTSVITPAFSVIETCLRNDMPSSMSTG